MSSTAPPQESILARMNLLPQEQDAVKQVIAQTKKSAMSSIRQKINRQRDNTGEALEEGVPDIKPRKISGIIEYKKEEVWTINAENSWDQLLVYYSEGMYDISDRTSQDYHISSSISVLKLTSQVSVKDLRTYQCGVYGAPPREFAKIAVSGISMWDYEPHNHHLDPDRYDSSGCDSELDEIDTSIWFKYESRSVENEINFLGIEGLTQDLFIKYLIALVEPNVDKHAVQELQKAIRDLVEDSNANVSADDGTWFNIWKLHVQ
jgi:hypothetical protein